MSDYKDQTVLICTHGLFVSWAQRFAREYGHVLLCVPHTHSSFPTMNGGLLGYGMENVEIVESIFCPQFDTIDLFVFPDLGFADEQLYLESIGKTVWGGRAGEEIENFRDLCKQEMTKLGLPVQPWKKLVGMDALREHIKTHANQFVKLNRWRGHFETFKSVDYETSKVKLDEIEHKMGANVVLAEFIVEDEIPDAVEIGIDTFCIDGQHPPATIVGIEVKDLGYVGQFMEWDKIPALVREWHEKMGPVFAKYGYKGCLSNEQRITQDLVGYMIDCTARAPSPPSELFQEQYANFCEIITEGAKGNVIAPVAAAKWGVEIIMRSSWAEKNWQPISFDPKFTNQVKLFNAECIASQWFIVPQDEELKEIGAIIGLGDTLEAAVENAKEVAATIKGFGIEIPDGSIDRAKEQMEQLAEFGLPVFDLEESPTTK
jgi:hypothetical protein